VEKKGKGIYGRRGKGIYCGKKVEGYISLFHEEIPAKIPQK
jgi:hypothetical protein